MADKDKYSVVILEEGKKKLFESKLIVASEIEGLEFCIFENRIHYIRVPDFEKLSMHSIQKLRESIEDVRSGRPYTYCNVLEFMTNSWLDPEVREWAASSSGSDGSLADAIVIKGMAHRMVANFYLNFNRPKKPTKFFTNLESAIIWSKEQLKERVVA